MAEIEQVSQGIKRLAKSKNLVIFAGAGAVLGAVMYFKNKASSTAAVDTSVPAAGATSAEIGQAVNSATGQLAQGLSDSMKAQNDVLAQAFQTMEGSLQQQNESVAQAFQHIGTELQQSQQAFQTSVNQQIGSIVDKISQLNSAASQPAAAPVYSPPQPSAPAAPKVTYFIGNSTDLSSAAAEKGGGNTSYINTETMSTSQVRSFLASHPEAVIVGGAGAGGGVSADASAGLSNLRLGGQDREETRQLIADAKF